MSGLRRALDQVLGLFEAEAGDLADDLDDGDLVRAGFLELDVELGLLLGGRGRRGSRGRGAAATATGAALTPHLSSRVLISSAIWMTGQVRKVIDDLLTRDVCHVEILRIESV